MATARWPASVADHDKNNVRAGKGFYKPLSTQPSTPEEVRAGHDGDAALSGPGPRLSVGKAVLFATQTMEKSMNQEKHGGSENDRKNPFRNLGRTIRTEDQPPDFWRDGLYGGPLADEREADKNPFRNLHRIGGDAACPPLGLDAIDWDESEHPRDRYGKFTRSGSGGGSARSTASGRPVAARPGGGGRARSTASVRPVSARLGGGGTLYAQTAGSMTDAGAAANPAVNVTRGVRNNNPLNVIALRRGGPWNGQTGTDNEGFAMFNSVEDGFRAGAIVILAHQVRHNRQTIQEITSRHASSSSADEQANYARYVARELGITPDTVVNLQDPAILSRMMRAMIEFENGRATADRYTDEQLNTAANAGIAHHNRPRNR